MNIFKALHSLNPNEVRKLIDSGEKVDIVDEFGRSILHIAVQLPVPDDSLTEIKSRHSSVKNDIIYMLIDAGIDLELRDMNGKTCLWYAAEICDVEACIVLLQCGADMYCTNLEGASLLDEVFNDTMIYECDVDDEMVNSMQDVFENFYPGLWKAVESRDICQARRLTNLWCKTDLVKNDKTLKELASDTGHEEMITLIYGIHDTMKLIHHLYAQDTKTVIEMLSSSRKNLQLDLRKMSERGAPILYYLIQWNDAEMIELFIKHGCHVYTIMRDESNVDMPVLFSALEKNVSAEVVEALLPVNTFQQEEMLYKLLYKGQTLLETALEKNCNLNVFDVIVDRGGPLLVMDRNELNQSVREIATNTDRVQYVDVIDKNVSMWIMQPDKYPGRRQALALYGYDGIEVDSGNDKNDSNDAKIFLDNVEKYQDQIAKLVEATEAGDLETFVHLQNFDDELQLFERNLCWDGRLKGDGLPLLHRAVLFNHPHLVKIILDTKPNSQSVDTLFDHYHRTALHYASACSSFKEVRKLLTNSGCSEHVLDRKNKEPLDFRDKQDTPLMLELIKRLKLKAYHTAEPDPWLKDAPQVCEYSQHRKPSYIYLPSENIWTYDSEANVNDSIEANEITCNENNFIEDDTESESENQQPNYCNIL